MRDKEDEDDDTQVYKKPWVGLTEEEMEDIWNERGWYVTLFQKVEAKLKEKNT
jgi:hypothetical protein